MGLLSSGWLKRERGRLQRERRLAREKYALGLLSPEVNLDARGKLSPPAAREVEGGAGDLHQVVGVVAGVDEEAHLGDDVGHVGVVAVTAHVEHPLVSREVFPLVARDPLRDVADNKAPLHLVMHPPTNYFKNAVQALKYPDQIHPVTHSLYITVSNRSVTF